MPTGDSTSNATLESPQGQDDQTSQQPGETTGEAPAKQDKPNWYDDPKFRETQSKLQRQADEAKQQAAYAQQQNMQLQQRLRELELRDLSQEEQTQFRLREAEQAALQWQQAYTVEMQRQQIENEKRDAIKELLGDGDYPDVKPDDLMGTKSATEAAKLAARLQKTRDGSAQAEQDERRRANKPNVGGGRPPSNNDWESRFNAAKTATELARLLAERGRQ